MINYIKQVHKGVKGRITCPSESLDAIVAVEGRAKPYISTDSNGWYYRLLVPGTYNLVYTCVGPNIKYSKTISVTVKTGDAVIVNAVLTEADAV